MKLKKRRKNLNSQALIISIIFVFAIFVSGIYFGSNLLDYESENNINTGDNTKNLTGINMDQDKTYFMGDEVNLSGSISGSGNIGSYTHLFDTNDKYGLDKKIGLKSRSIVLNNYTGYSLIKGRIDNITDKMYIVEVNEIKNIDKEENEEEKEDEDDEKNDEEEKNKNVAYFNERGIYFDFGANTGYQARGVNNEIKIFDVSGTGGNLTGVVSTGGNELLTISPFVCDDNTGGSQCENRKTQFDTLGFENFVSDNGIKYYNIAETPQWIFFNETWFGYYVSPSSESDLINLSKFINIQDKEYVKNNLEKKEKIKSRCDEDGINTMDLSFNNGKLVGEIKCFDSEGNELLLDVEISIGSNFSVDIIEEGQTGIEKIKKDSNSNEQDNSEEQNDSTDENQQTNNNGTGDTEDLEISDNVSFNTENSLEFTSKRGFTIYFPQNVIYAGEILDSVRDFGMKNTSCNYKVNVSYWRAESASKNPYLEIFSCDSDLKDDKIRDYIKSKDMIYMKGGDKKFLLKYNNKYGKSIADNIDIQS